MNIITGYTGEPHITSEQDRDANQGSYGTGSYILDVGAKMAATIISANEVRIADGVLSHQGCVGNINKGQYESCAIENGSQGMRRNDLIVCRYEKNPETNVESLSLVVIKGTPTSSTPSDPSYSSGNIQSGASPVDMPLFRVNINGITISSITRIASYVRTQAETDTLIGNTSISGIGSGTVTSALSTINGYFSQTRTQPSIYQNRCTALSGGYIKIGNLIIVTVQFSASATFSGSQAYLSGMPVPIVSRGVLSVYGQAAVAPHLQAHVTDGGYITISGDVTNGETISVSGTYITSA